MTKQEFFVLASKYAEGSCSTEEREAFEEYFEKLYSKGSPLDSWTLSKIEQTRLRLITNIQSEMNQETTAKIGQKRKVRNIVWSAAAAIALLIGTGWLVWSIQPEETPTQMSYINKSTGKGQKTTITLDDGSRVRLNSESSISFPEIFSEDRREIELVGEAFFEVQKDENRPFIVTTHNLQTTVLGTSFNINAYDTLSVGVALVSGQVKVKPIGHKSELNKSDFYLNPGESVRYNDVSGHIRKEYFDEKKITAWKDNIIYMADADYDKVFNQLSHWYGVEFRFENAPSEMWNYSGEFKDMSLELVMNTIGYSKGFEFQIRNDVVEVKFNN